MGTERFYLEESPDGSTVRLSLDESHHLRHVRRVRPGDRVVLFDGSGVDYLGRVVEFDRSGVTVEILGTERGRREPGVAVTLAVGVVKPRAMAALIDACTQLGLSRLVPMLTERSVVRPDGKRVARWRRLAVEACKQCGRSVVPDIAGVRAFADVLKSVTDYGIAVVGATRGRARPLAEAVDAAAASVLCLIGPEGGLTEAEEQAAVDAGCVPVALADSILRTETAAAAALAVVAQAALGEKPPRAFCGTARADGRHDFSDFVNS